MAPDAKHEYAAHRLIINDNNVPLSPVDKFRWSDLDRRLLSPKVIDLAEKMQKRIADGERRVAFQARQSGNAASYLPRLFDFHEQLVDEWAEGLYAVHCEAWAQQKRTVSPAFIRAVRDQAILQLISLRTSSVEAEVTRRGTASSNPPNPIALGEWKRRMNRMAGRWKRKLEAEAVASEYRASSAQDDDRRFALMAIEEARKSVPEDDRPHPKVGAVIVKDGKVLSTAHRGENLKSHAEYIALEAKLPDDLVAGSTVYTTLEPCTTRKHPKIPCAQRLVDRKVYRVVIGMLDPNPEIRGLGDQMLSDAGIEVQLFPRGLRAQVEELNREFVRAQRQKQLPGTVNDPDRAATAAARLLSDATRELQKAAWSFYTLHTAYGVARAVRDVIYEEKQIFDRIDAAFTVFTHDYDVPTDLSDIAKSEMEKIQIALVNLKMFSRRNQESDMRIAATQIEDACERIRIAARPYAYRK